MIRISGIRVPEGSDREHVKKKAAHILRVKPEDIRDFKVLKRSVDARQRNGINEVYTVSLSVDDEKRIVRKCGRDDVVLTEEKIYELLRPEEAERGHRPVICGFGPAGMFAALLLAHAGLRPLVLERGSSMEGRVSDVEDFFRTGVLRPDSNVQFGEGGAGTFSDGKLNTGIKDREGRLRFILETFVRHGADEAILTGSHPHIGTDRLREIIPSIRREIEDLCGEIHFETRMTGIVLSGGDFASTGADGTLERQYKISGIHTDEGVIPCDSLLLCIGHSARDTFEMLTENGIYMEAKPFAIGVRAEHKRRMIDEAMHQESASYKLTYHCSDGRGVYSFCMCPGGYVVNASSEEGHLCVNGMSLSGRDGMNSNAAIVCTISTDDYRDWGDDALAGVRFQRELERRAYEECGGAIPCQLYEDFCNDSVSLGFGEIQPECKGRYAMGNIRRILPEYVCNDIMEAMPSFGRRIAGYDRPDILFAGLESRTSSPVRILRGDDMQSLNVRGLYPAGEGAGYAGGIMSAAIDGMKCAEQYIRSC